MVPGALLFALIGAGVVVQVEESDLGTESRKSVAEALGAAIEARTGEPSRVASALAACEADRAACAERARAGEVREVVLVRLLESPRRIRLEAERWSPGATAATATAAQDLPRDPEVWRALLDDSAARLFPASAPPPRASVAGPERGLVVSPWFIAASSLAVASLGAGIGVGAASASVRAEIEGRALLEPEHRRLSGDLSSLSLAANALFAVAGASALAAGASFWLDQ